MLSRSPTVAFSATASAVFSAGTDSPVRAASSVRRFFTSTRRRSAGTLSPDSSRTTSPGTRLSAGIMRVSPSRRVRASADSMLRMESSAFSARPSWMKPSKAFSSTTPRMIPASSHRPSISLVKPAPSSTYTRTLLNCVRKRANGPRFLPSGRRFGPYLARRFAASAVSRPFAGSVSSRLAVSWVERACQNVSVPAGAFSDASIHLSSTPGRERALKVAAAAEAARSEAPVPDRCGPVCSERVPVRTATRADIRVGSGVHVGQRRSAYRPALPVAVARLA